MNNQIEQHNENKNTNNDVDNNTASNASDNSNSEQYSEQYNKNLSWNDNNITIASIKKTLDYFNQARNWGQFHTPKALASAIAVEAGELLELFLWVDLEIKGSRPFPKKESLEMEIADVAICLINLCHQTNIDLSDAIQKKIELNGEKYPVEKSQGNALKYNELK